MIRLISTTCLTSPQSSAFLASRKFPVRLSSFALLMPTNRGSFCDKPQPGTTPTRAWVSANFALVEAIRKSHMRASSNPPVIAKPLMAPMIGFLNSLIAVSRSRLEARSDFAFSPPSSLRSKPTVNAQPAPVRIMTLVLSSFESSSKVELIWFRKDVDNAFKASGRFKVTNVTPARRSSRTSS